MKFRRLKEKRSCELRSKLIFSNLAIEDRRILDCLLFAERLYFAHCRVRHMQKYMLFVNNEVAPVVDLDIESFILKIFNKALFDIYGNS